MKNSILEKIKDLRDHAELIYAIGGNGAISDYKYCQEEFFKTKDGQYFIVGTGGAGSQYRTGNGATSRGAQKVIPISKAWAEKRIKMHKNDYRLIGDEFIHRSELGY